MQNGRSVVLIGSACFDIRATVGGPVALAATNAGWVRFSPGGTARNIAENLARLDVPTRLFTAVGDDGLGQQIIRATRAAGVIIDDDALLIVDGQVSGSFLTVLGHDQQPIIAVDGTTVVQAITPELIARWRRQIAEAALVVIDATLDPETIAAIICLCREADVSLCIEPVSVALASRIVPFLADATLITPNMREAAALSGMPVRDRDEALLAARSLQERGVETVIVTMAGGGAVYASVDLLGHVPAVRTEVLDGTGAGDALTAGVIFGILNDFPLDETVRLGTVLASLTMQTIETVRADLTLEQVYAHLTP